MIEQLAKIPQTQCCHGRGEDILGRWLDKFMGDFYALVREKEIKLDPNWYDPTGSIFWHESMKSMCRMNPEVLHKSKRERLKSRFLSTGTVCVLDGIDDSNKGYAAGCIALCVLFLEQYDNPHKCVDDIEMYSTDMKQRDLFEGCWPSIVCFYAKRIPCNCLDHLYAETKSQPKTGICRWCSERLERCDLMVCMDCCKEQYCSKYCQVSDWPRHRITCKGLQATVKEEQAEQEVKQPTDKEREAFAKGLQNISGEDLSKLVEDLREKCPSCLTNETDDALRILFEKISPVMFRRLAKCVNVLIKCQSAEGNHARREGNVRFKGFLHGE